MCALYHDLKVQSAENNCESSSVKLLDQFFVQKQPASPKQSTNCTWRMVAFHAVGETVAHAPAPCQCHLVPWLYISLVKMTLAQAAVAMTCLLVWLQDWLLQKQGWENPNIHPPVPLHQNPNEKHLVLHGPRKKLGSDFLNLLNWYELHTPTWPECNLVSLCWIHCRQKCAPHQNWSWS